MDQAQLSDVTSSFLPVNMRIPDRLPTQSPSDSAFNNMNYFSNTPLDDYVNSGEDPINATFASPALPVNKQTAFHTPNRKQVPSFGRRVQSDTGTGPDSGYGTLSAGAWQSAGNASSICEDPSETASGPSGFPPLPTTQWPRNVGPNHQKLSMSVDGDATRDADVMRYGSIAGSTAHTLLSTIETVDGSENSPSTGRGQDLVCEKCGRKAKTASEFTKHLNRHLRPYKCTVAGCKWEKGFATVNDRDRHERNVHRDDITAPAEFYICTIEPCKKKGKQWPRLDNFRHHLSNVHKVAKLDIPRYCTRHREQQHNDLAGLSPAPVMPPASLADAVSMGARFDAALSQNWPMDMNFLNVMTNLQDRGARNIEDLRSYIPRFPFPQPFPGTWPMILDSSSAEDNQSSALSLLDSPGQMLQNLGQDSNHAASILASLARVSNVASQGTTAMGPPETVRRRNPLPNSRGYPQINRQTGSFQAITSSSLESLTVPLANYSGRFPPQQGFARTVTPSISQASSRHDKAMSETRSATDDDCSVIDIVLNDERPAANATENVVDENADEDDEEKEDIEDLEPTHDGSSKEKLNTTKHSRALVDADTHKDTATGRKAASRSVATMPQTEPRELIPRIPTRDLLLRETLTNKNVADILKELRKVEGFDTIMADLGFQKVEPPKPAPKIAPSVADQLEDFAKGDLKSQAHYCSQVGCNRSFVTKSGLRKHMKRHDKPYSCTFPDCDSRFGSKDDWKRHEDSQHIHVESWRCVEKIVVNGGTPALCGKKFDSGKDFQGHLEKDHGVDNLETQETLARDYKSGTGYDPFFWCGFCKRDILVVSNTNKDSAGSVLDDAGVDKDSQETNKEDDGTVTSRFIFRQRSDHIDDHFMGRLAGKDITEWESQGHPNLYETALETEPPTDEDVNEAVEIGGIPVPRKRNHDESLPDSGQDEQDGKPVSKRPKRQIAWLCCSCSTDRSLDLNSPSLVLNTRCLECNHQPCGNCVFSYLPYPEQK